MDNFLAAVDSRQGVNIIIAGQPVYVARCRLLAHLQLSKLETDIQAKSNPVEISALIIEYLFLAGLSDSQIKEASTYELLEAFFALRYLNAWQWLLPWLAKPGQSNSDPEIYDYEGRRWAVWVHKIASRYKWSPETIWNLWPEEAAAYLQEIMLSEYSEREDRRALSQLSYNYDKITKTYHYVPAPMYSWMVDDRPPKPVRIPVSALPVGNVIRLDN